MFPKSIRFRWNANSLIQYLNSDRCVNFLRQLPLRNVYIYIYIYRLRSFHILMLYTYVRLYVFFMRLILARIVFGSRFYRDRSVILLNSEICVCECPTGVNCRGRPLSSADVFFYVYTSMYILRAYISVSVNLYICTWIDVYTHPCTHTF